MKYRKVKSMTDIKNDPRVDEVLDERNDDNGYWVYLVPGFYNEMTETHSIHEMTVKECCDYLNSFVVECDCEQCQVQYKESAA